MIIVISNHSGARSRGRAKRKFYKYLAGYVCVLVAWVCGRAAEGMVEEMEGKGTELLANNLTRSGGVVAAS